MALSYELWLNPVKKLILLLDALRPACKAIILALAATTPAKAIDMLAFCATLTAFNTIVLPDAVLAWL